MKKHFIIAAAALFLAAALTACGEGPQVISPTPTSSVAPTDRPATPTDVPSTDVPPTDQPAEPTLSPTPDATPTPTPELPLDQFDPLEFFKDAAYCGDSLMNFYMWRGNSYVNPKVFGSLNQGVWFAVNSYALRFAVADGFSASEPKYKGDQVKMWDVFPQLGKHRLFFFFGLNDIGVSGVDLYIENYKTFLSKIEATGFEAKFYIMSITSMREDKQSTTGGLTNAKIKEANEKLEALCAERGWTFVDVASKLRDENYNLLLEYSDGTNVHIIKEGYKFWDEALEQLAREELRKEYWEKNK